MVRLEVFWYHSTQQVSSNFNSSMVRLEVNSSLECLSATRFQFQYGAIRSKALYKLRFFIIAFQFQYGAIRSER